MEPSPGDTIPCIPGIDTPELLERIGEDLELFWEVLIEFSGTYRDAPAQIAAALSEDPAQAKQLAHTLKGVLGNLSANTLFSTCKALDDAIREGQSQLYGELLNALDQGVPALCDAIEAARSPNPVEVTASSPPIESAWLNERYKMLMVALEGHRARDCKNITEEIGHAALPTDERSFFDQLQALVRAYRFKEAQALLEKRIHV